MVTFWIPGFPTLPLRVPRMIKKCYFNLSMARFYKKKNKYLLGQELRYASLVVLVCIGLIVCFYLLGVLFKRLSTDFLTVALSYFTVFVIFVVLFKKMRKQFFLYRAGRRGEMRIAKELKKLPDSYNVFAGVDLDGRGDVDFLVIGPSGIYAVEAKNHSGRIGFDGRNITRNSRKLDDKDILWQVKDNAMKIKKHIISGMSEKHFVDAVLVFSNKHARIVFDNKEEVRETKVLQTEQLNEYILSRSMKFPEVEVIRIARLFK